MMERTDRHERYLLRQITRRTLLYTEMIPTGALLRGDADRWLAFDRSEHPVAVQLGGAVAAELAACARMAEERGFDEVNMNVGCPSARVERGRFGACLMAEPDVVARCVHAMRETVDIPVTVKTRIGIDDRDSYAELVRFVDTVAGAGCRTFIVHARKAWLGGLSPKANRTLPPLRYDRVRRLKQDFPELEFILNGGLDSLDAVRQQLGAVDGAMIGREAYRNPYLLAGADSRVFDEPSQPATRRQIAERMLPYVERELAQGTPLSRITRHLLGLYQACPGARQWRRHLSEHAHLPGAGVEVIVDALECVTNRDS